MHPDLFDSQERLSSLRMRRAELLLSEAWPRRIPLLSRRALSRVRSAAPCLRGDVLGKNMAGLGQLWGYFPNAASVKVGGVSLADKIESPSVMADIARKTVAFCERHERGRVSRNRAFQSLKAYNGHHVSNFRPVAARDIYLSLVGRGASVFDPCGGWGGRMMGAIAADAKRYVAVDAARLTVEGLRALASDLGSNAEAHHGAVEDFDVEREGFDIAFTSPPYFDAERYSDESEQSCVRFGDYPAWRDGFLARLCEKMSDAVAVGGVVAINIADVRGLPLSDDAVSAMLALGLEHERTMRYALSSIAGAGIKYEPVFVFRKTHNRRTER